MTPTNPPPSDVFASGLIATANLLEAGFTAIEEAGWTQAVLAHSEMELLRLRQKTGPFYRYYRPLRQRMTDLLAESYRRLFKLALANPNQTGADAHMWALTQLQPAVGAALEWIHEWYVLACDGESQSVRHVGSLDFVPGGTASLSIPTTVPALQPSTSWRAPAWLFGISIALFGIGGLKNEHIPNMDSEEKLGGSHTRLLLKGARRVLLWELEASIERVRNEEIAAAGAIRAEVISGQKRRTIKRKGWEERLKLYEVIRTILSANPSPEGMKFCAELDKRHAPPLYAWVKSGQWRQGLTWKEAWANTKLRPKIRRVRQEAQRAKW